MSKDPINTNNAGKVQLTPEQIKQLIQMQAMMQNQQNQQKMKKSMKIMQVIFQKMMQLQQHLDRFINFITKSEDEKRNDVVQSARSPILFGTYVVFIFVVFGGLWVSTAPLNSATVALGTVISSSQKKTVQNVEQGIIKSILVKQGDLVKEGQPLIEMDDIRAKADYEGTLHQYRILLASEARLIAERDGLEEIEFPEFLVNDKSIAEVEKIMHTQEKLFGYKKDAYLAAKESTKHEINQATKQVEALEASKIAAQKSYEVWKEKAKGLKTLFAKGATAKNHLLEAEANEANAKSKLAETEANIERAKQELTKTEIKQANIDNEYLSKVLTELREIQINRGVIQEKYNTVRFSLDKIVIRAPVDGTVNIVNVHTIGMVVPGGQGLLEISPTNDNLIIEVNIPHRNIDAVKIGLISKIRFSAFKSRTTSTFTGTLVSLSPDVVLRKTPQGEEGYYHGKVEIDMEEFKRLTRNTKLELHPGMQAEVQIITGKRTLLRYLLDPLTDTMFRAFNEK